MSSEEDSPKTKNSKMTRVGGIVLDSEQNLLIVLGKKSQKWGVPKGVLEENENFLTGALREIREETGLRLKPESTKNLQFWGVNRARLYILQVDEEKPKLKPHDTNEIERAMWLNLQNQHNVDEVELNANKMLLAVLKKLRSCLGQHIEIN